MQAFTGQIFLHIDLSEDHLHLHWAELFRLNKNTLPFGHALEEVWDTVDQS